MIKSLPKALSNLLIGPKALSSNEKFELYSKVFPNMNIIEPIRKKKFQCFEDDLFSIKFPDIGLMFGSHGANHFEKGLDVPSLIIPIKGSVQIHEKNTNIKLKHCANERIGSYLCGDLTIGDSEPTLAVAVGFNPSKLLETMRSISKNEEIELPEIGFNINFKNEQMSFLLERFLFSLNALGSFKLFNKVGQELILRHCASIILCAQGKKLPRKVFVDNSNIIDYVCGYMYSDLSRVYTLNSLVSFSGISARSLQVEFKKRFQLSPLAWLYEQRMMMAHQILSAFKCNIKVSDVSKDCGFTHLGRFSVDFKKKFGISPLNLKKNRS
jgi:AraC-like DNA-binding protein